MKKVAFIIAVLWFAGFLVAQQKVDVAKISATATGSQTAVNSDSIVCASDTGCVIKAAAGNIADGAEVTIGAKADAKSAATDTTAVTIMQVLKEISALEQAPAPQAFTYSGTMANGLTASMTATTSTSVISGTASNYVYVSSCSVTNIHASVDTLVDLQDGSGGTVLWTFAAPHGYGGESHTFGDHPLKVPTSGNGLFAADEITGASVKVACNGFKSTTSY